MSLTHGMLILNSSIDSLVSHTRLGDYVCDAIRFTQIITRTANICIARIESAIIVDVGFLSVNYIFSAVAQLMGL